MPERANDKTQQTALAPITMGQRGLELRTLDDLWRFAQFVTQSGMAPKGMDQPAQILVAIQHGAEVGLSPMQSVQSIAVINGRPSLWGDGFLAVVQASPLCEGIAETININGDEITAICRAKRRGRSDWTERRFGVAEAKKAGLWNKQGSWQAYPQRMLQMRARSFCLRDTFPDVLRGIACTEELLDYPESPLTESTALLSGTEALKEQLKEQAPPVTIDRTTGAKLLDKVAAEPKTRKRKPVAAIANTTKTETEPPPTNGGTDIGRMFDGEPAQPAKCELLRCPNCPGETVWDKSLSGRECLACGAKGVPVETPNGNAHDA